MDSGLSSEECDALKEVANIGAGHALGVLSSLLQHKIELGLPELKYRRINPISNGSTKDFIAIFSPVMNPNLKGNIILAFPWDSYQYILKLIDSNNNNIIRNEEELTQIGATVFDTYSRALEHLLQFNLDYKGTSYILSTKKDYLLPILKNTNYLEEFALLIKTEFKIRGTDAVGYFEMAFAKSAIEQLKKSIKDEYGI